MSNSRPSTEALQPVRDAIGERLWDRVTQEARHRRIARMDVIAESVRDFFEWQDGIYPHNDTDDEGEDDTWD